MVNKKKESNLVQEYCNPIERQEAYSEYLREKKNVEKELRK